MTTTDDPIDPIDSLLDLFEDRLDEDDIDGAREVLAKAAELAGEDDPEVRLCAATLAYADDGPEAAMVLLDALVRDEPEYGDAWYALGELRAETDDEAGMIAAFLEVQRLDAALDVEWPPVSRELLDRIEGVAREVIDGLPPEIGRPLTDVPVVLEDRPAAYLVSEGFDPRAYGLFEGRQEGDNHTPAPTRVVLYTHCLLESFGEGDELDEQVEVTVLHELGHFFGLDEDDVARLGLA
jgi:predicted Zn-dependent protease with MMP-like domain